MFQLDLKSGVPICDQVVNGFIRLQAIGVLSGGDQLPSVRSLASQLSVNPNTVQKAYAILEANGIIYSVKGKGSFLSDDSRAHQAVRENAIRSLREAVLSVKELGLSQEDCQQTVAACFEKSGEGQV